GRRSERGAADGGEVVGGGRLGTGEAVVREEDDARGAEAARRLDVFDRLRRREAVGANAGPDGAAACGPASGGDLFRGTGRPPRVGHPRGSGPEAGPQPGVPGPKPPRGGVPPVRRGRGPPG